MYSITIYVTNAAVDSDATVSAYDCGIDTSSGTFIYGGCTGAESGYTLDLSADGMPYSVVERGISCSEPQIDGEDHYVQVSSLRIDIGDVPGERQVFAGWPKTMLDVAALGYDNDDHIQYGFAYIRSSIGAETELNPGIYYDPLYIVLSKNSQNEYVLNIDESRSVVQTQPVGLR